LAKIWTITKWDVFWDTVYRYVVRLIHAVAAMPLILLM